MKTIYTIALSLLVLSGLNWALVALFDLNLITSLFGVGSAFSKLLYVLMGLSSLAALGIYSYLRGIEEIKK